MQGRLVLTIAASLLTLTAYPAEDWPQFRGPGGRAVSDTANPPIGFGPSSNVLWKVAAGSGFSSPVVSGDRIFLTAAINGKPEVLCFSRKDGHVLWRKQVLRDLPKAAAPERLASATPVTDGKSVYALVGLFGLIAYDANNGDEQWRQANEAADEETSASPILIDDKVIVAIDKDRGSFVEALDKKSGRAIWRTERPQFSQSRATPFHWINAKRNELILSGSLWLTSYDPVTGHENWRYSGTSMNALSSPAADENLLFYASAQDGTVNTADGGGGSLGSTPLLADLDSFLQVPPKPGKGIFAIQSCGRGDITASHLAWKSMRGLPGYSSPLFYKGRLFTIKSGGLLSAYDVKDGSALYQEERIDAPGDYYASAVAAAGRVYLTSENGIVTVIDADAGKKNTPAILSQNKIGEKVLATPALIERTILIRTETTLYSFEASR